MKKFLVCCALLISVAAFAGVDSRIKNVMNELNTKYEVLDSGIYFKLKGYDVLLLTDGQTSLRGKGYPIAIICKHNGTVSTRMKDWMLKNSTSDNVGYWVLNQGKPCYKIVLPSDYTEKELLMSMVVLIMKAEEFEKEFK